MKAEVTAIIEKAQEGGFWAMCPEFPEANGQGETIEETTENLKQAIELIIQDRIDNYCRGLPDDVIKQTLIIA